MPGRTVEASACCSLATGSAAADCSLLKFVYLQWKTAATVDATVSDTFAQTVAMQRRSDAAMQ